MNFRKAVFEDLPAIEAIYRRIHEAEKRGDITSGWIENVYPVRATAEAALNRGELYVCEENGAILASAVVNREQDECYETGDWHYPADALVLHTLAVNPAVFSRGVGSAFVAFYESLARENGCRALRLDTNRINGRAQALYRHLGFREAGVVRMRPDSSTFLVLYEKEL